MLSRHCLPWEPSVLLFMISSFREKEGKKVNCASVSVYFFLECFPNLLYFPRGYTCPNNVFCNWDFNGAVYGTVGTDGPGESWWCRTAEVSSVRAAEVSSVWGAEGSGVGAAEVSSVEAAGAAGAGECTKRLASTSALKHSKVSMSIVDRSWSGGTLADKLTDNGSMFSGLGYCEKKEHNRFVLIKRNIMLESSAFPTNGQRMACIATTITITIVCLSHSLSNEKRNYRITKVNRAMQTHMRNKEVHLPRSLRFQVASRSLPISAPCFPPLRKRIFESFHHLQKKEKYILHMYIQTNSPCSQYFPTLKLALDCLLERKMTRKELYRVRTLLAETLLMHVFTVQSLSWPRSWSFSRAHSRFFSWSCCFRRLISSRVSSEVTFVFLFLEASRLADHFPSLFSCSTKNVWYGSFSADWRLTSGIDWGLTLRVDGWLRPIVEDFSPTGFT